jgi:D-glycero-D-manno-heptose 1,7-bisphosphate phosphatase
VGIRRRGPSSLRRSSFENAAITSPRFLFTILPAIIRPVLPMPALRPAIFLDRDGTLNVQVVREGKPYPPATLAEFALFTGVPEACAQLAAAGFVLVVATNQPDVGRGDQAQAVVESMHTRLRELVPAITHIEVCYAPGQGRPHPEDYRRKPDPGMLTDAAKNLGLDLSRSWMVGDRWRDIDCGQRAGVRTVFIDFGYAEELRAAPDFTVKNFNEATAVILNATQTH